MQREINDKRQELLARESQLKDLEARMTREHSSAPMEGELNEVPA